MRKVNWADMENLVTKKTNELGRPEKWVNFTLLIVKKRWDEERVGNVSGTL